MTSGNCLLTGGILAGFVAAVVALQCFQCGQYNDGVGSITPCINETHMKLKECPSRDHGYCIKYISEGSTVRDCVAKCTERGCEDLLINNNAQNRAKSSTYKSWHSKLDDWGSKTFCCSEEACNSGLVTNPSAIAMTVCGILVLAAQMH